VILAAGPPRTYQITFDGGNMLKRNVNAVTTETSLLEGANVVNVVVTTTTPGVNATGLGSPPGKLLLDTTNGVMYQNTGTALAPVWTARPTTTASTAELNVLAAVVAGTVSASKAVVVGANKNIDTLALPASGLKIGAGAGTAVDATAAELNVLAAVVAGTASASKAAVLGANKNLDALAIADGGLALGAGAGTPITATAAEINAKVAAAGMAADGLGTMGVARFTFDASIGGNQGIGAHALSVTLPIHAVVIGGFFDVNTVFHSAGADAGSIAISVEGANDIQAAAAVSGAPYSTIGRKAIVPKSNTPESTSVKCTAARAITCTVAGQVLTAGKLTGFLHYVVSVASA
jgi:hypothetical protein